MRLDTNSHSLHDHMSPWIIMQNVIPIEVIILQFWRIALLAESYKGLYRKFVKHN